jgi:ribosomal protein L7/L12
MDWLLELLPFWWILELFSDGDGAGNSSALIARLDGKAKALLDRLGIEQQQQQPFSDRVMALARNPATKIQAIKALREETGMGLKAAKDAVEGSGLPAGAALEQKIDLLLKHFGVEYQPTVPPEVADLLRQGRKIAAIKAYRERTGAGLKEAKQEVERIAAGLDSQGR